MKISRNEKLVNYGTDRSLKIVDTESVLKTDIIEYDQSVKAYGRLKIVLAISDLFQSVSG